MNTYSKIEYLRNNSDNKYWLSRITSEILYLYSLNKANSLNWDKQIDDALNTLILSFKENEGVSEMVVIEIEKTLQFTKEYAKSFRAHLVSHAHIDMNWMWGYQETSAVVLDTLRTMLNFMREYPDFTFSQSQASVYQIVERFDKDMLEEIKERIKEGRWEVSASTWVENDKNMSCFEAQVRQVLYTKSYLSALLDIAPDSLELDFEPDTFGHSENVPAILNGAGIKYYYHCRGFEDEQCYNWQAPSGEQLLVYREPKWYNADVEPYMLSDMPLMTCKYGLKDMLMVYGVGDHGGGPTRRDINQLIDMMKWPLYPTMQFSSYKNFFKAIEPFRNQLPVVKGELNFVFTGCYTTQSRVKRGNKFAEMRLYDSEVITSGIYEVLNFKPQNSSYEEAWRNVLFNQFHDILPGSGMNETREYALGLFQESLALSNNEEQKALRKFISQIDTSDYTKNFDEDGGESEGGGAGYSISHVQGYMFGQTERGTGSTRICHVFNTTSQDREECFEIVLFDYHHPLELIEVKDSDGNVVPSKVTENHQYYWKHIVTKVSIVAKVPAFGYATYVVYQKEDDREVDFTQTIIHRVHNIGDMPVVLENEYLRAEFDKTDMTLNSLIDKRVNEELVKESSACFEYIRESNKRGESSWIVAEFMSLKNINKEYDVKYLESSTNKWNQFIKYRVEFGDSNIEATISLKPESKTLDYDIWVNWVEPGTRATYIPQLRFSVNLSYQPEEYKYDIPMGIKSRVPLAFDVPACSFQYAEHENSGVVLITAEKYGFRGNNSKMSLDLLRSSFDPDPYPELGRHQIKFSVGVASSSNEAKKIAEKICHPLISIPGIPGRIGNLNKSGYFFKSENCEISAIKVSEEEDGIIVRVYNDREQKRTAKFTTFKEVSRVFLCDACENIIGEFKGAGNTITIDISPYSYKTLKLIFK